MLLQYLDEWLSEVRFAKNTIISYECDVRSLLSYANNSELTPSIVRGWMASKEKSAKSNARSLCALRSFIKFLLRKGIPAPDDLLFIKNPKFNKSLPRAINADEIKFSNLIVSSGDWVWLRDRAVVLLMYCCGMRISEVLSLKLDDINEEHMFIKVCGKGSKERIVPLLHIAHEALNEYLKNCPWHFTSIIFYSKQGKILTRNNFSMHFKKLLAQYNLPFKTSAHSFRHSFATHLLENGANLKEIQMLLGHSQLTSTDVYTKVTNMALKEMVNSG